ncbi:transporter [Rubrobacter marinus]|uniref:Transporter n=1 Tax=Rubrobacter marinus TaxID=2653852 RepID=A0A6G8PVJ5_9ACTN|nr:AEC family transporter [Rubrobacter marinus]QIN78228.1 transporter [Rubrobacter marinus]
MLLDVFSRVMVPILVVVGAGFWLRRVTDLDVRPLTRVTLYLLSPALIFSSLVEAEIGGGQTLRIVAFSVLLVAAMGLLALAAGRALGYSRETNTALMLSTMFTNTGNYGLPLALFAFGGDGFDRAVLFFVAQGVLVHTLGIYLAGSGGGEGRGGWRGGATTLLRMPQLYAVAAALTLRWVGPEVVTQSRGVVGSLFEGISLMGSAAIPLLLVVLGAELARARVEAADAVGVSVAAAIRLLAAVPVSYGLARALGLDPLATDLAVVLGSMPTAVNVTVLALEFDVRPKLVGSIVVVTTVLSFATLTVLLGALGAGG